MAMSPATAIRIWRRRIWIACMMRAFFYVSPSCSPTRAALMAGTHPEVVDRLQRLLNAHKQDL
jgi:hypothetical protein